MERDPDSRIGNKGWLLLAGGIAIWDLTAKESLTHAFERYMGHDSKLVRIAAVGALAVTTAHLLGAIPRSVDPYYRIIDHYEKPE